MDEELQAEATPKEADRRKTLRRSVELPSRFAPVFLQADD